MGIKLYKMATKVNMWSAVSQFKFVTSAENCMQYVLNEGSSTLNFILR